MPDFKINITSDASSAVSAAKQTEAALQDVGKAIQDRLNPALVHYKQSAAGAAQETEGLTFKKADLKKMTKDLAHEFPELGRVARFALNPVVGSVAVLIGAFSVLKGIFNDIQTRLNTGIFKGSFTADAAKLKETLESSEVAFRSFQRAVAAAATAENELKEKSEAAIAAIRAQAVAQAEMQNASKAAELARVNMLESQGKLSGPRAIQERLKIEDKYAHRKLEGDVAAKEAELAAKRKRQADLDKSAGFEEKNAAQARTEMDEANVAAEKYKALLENSKKALEETDKQIKALEGAKFIGPGHRTQLRAAWGLRKQLSFQVNNLEDQSVGYADAATAATERYNQSTQRAKQLRGEASTLGRQIPLEQEAANAQYRTAGEVAYSEKMARTYTAAGEVSQQANQLAEGIQRSVESGKGVLMSVYKQLEEYNAFQRQMAERVSALERVKGF